MPTLPALNPCISAMSCLSILGTLANLSATVAHTLPVRLRCWFMTLPWSTPQTGKPSCEREIEMCVCVCLFMCLSVYVCVLMAVVDLTWSRFDDRIAGFRKPTSIEWKFTEEGERVRVSTRTGRIIPQPIFERCDGIVPQQWKGAHQRSLLLLACFEN